MKHFTNITSYEELKAQYRTLALANHPDVGGDAETMKSINNEYDALFIIWKQREKVETSETAASTRSEFYTQYGWKGENYNSKLTLKEIACLIREFAKTFYNDCKFSVTTSYASMCQELHISLMESPFRAYKAFSELNEEEKRLARKIHGLNGGKTCGLIEEIDAEIEKVFDKEHSSRFLTDEIQEPINAVKAYAKSFNYDDSDSMIDYHDVNFYFFGVAIGGKNPYKIVERTRTVTEPVEYENVTVTKTRTYKTLEPRKITPGPHDYFEPGQYIQLLTNFSHGKRRGYVYIYDRVSNGYLHFYKMGKGYKNVLKGKAEENHLTLSPENMRKWFEQGSIQFVELVEVEKTEEYTTVVRRPVKKQPEPTTFSPEIEEKTRKESSDNVRYVLNPEHNGIEIYFTRKPEQKTIDMLKHMRFRWHNAKKCWYNVQSDSTLAIAQNLIDGVA